MTWFLSAILGAFFLSVYFIGTKFILNKEENDPYVCAVAYRLIAALGAFAIVALRGSEFALAIDYKVVLAFAFGTFVFSLANMLIFKSYPIVDLSEISLIGATQPFFVFLMGVTLFGELFSWQKLVAVIAGFVGIASIYWHKQKVDFRSGKRFVLFATLGFAIGSFIDKYISVQVDPLFYVACGLSSTMVTIFIFGRVKARDVRQILRGRQGLVVMLISLFMLFGSVLLIQAYTLGAEASQVILTLYLSTVLVVLFGMIFFKERERIPQKILATVLTFVGLILIYR